MNTLHSGKRVKKLSNSAGFSCFLKGIDINGNLPEGSALTALPLAQSIRLLECKASDKV